MNKQDLYKLVIETYGSEAQINQGIEEMAELIQAINKFRRNPSVYPSWRNIAEELVDVEIMLEQYKLIYNVSTETISNFKSLKLKRLADRLGVKTYD